MPQEFSRIARSFAAVAAFTVLAACGGGGGSLNDGDGGDNGGDDGGGATTTVTGRISFDRLQFQTTVGDGLNAANPVESPAREVVVEAVSGSRTLATTTTNASGDYSLSVPANTSMQIRVRASMQKTGAAPNWSFTVRNNANSDAVYALAGDTFNSGTTNVTRNLRATSGWGTNSYTGTRASAPFAILDTVYRTKQLILGADPSAEFPALNLYWSDENRTRDCVSGTDCEDGQLPFCPDDGNIGTTFYTSDPSGSSVDDCNAALPDGIYILGSFGGGAGDTDEFDQHVIAHEFGHYFEDRFGRSDSIGGDHQFADRLDLRLAFGEGWGNAFSAMTLNDPEYRDSAAGISQDGGFNLETGIATAQGWFSEFSVGEFLWDVFDNNTAPGESGDSVALGFTPIYNVMTGEQMDTDALTSIFSFASALRSENGSQAGAINNLLSAEGIDGNDEFGSGETNDGGVPVSLPVYSTVGLGGAGQAYVCSSAAAGITGLNKLGNLRLVVFQNDAQRSVQIRANGITNNASQDAAVNPDIYVYRRGAVVATGTSADSNATTRRVETVDTTLAAGTYVIEVYDADLAPGARPRCMNLSVTG